MGKTLPDDRVNQIEVTKNSSAKLLDYITVVLQNVVVNYEGIIFVK
jgi:hypothetical protein